MRLIDADALISEIKKDTEKAIEQDDRVGSFWLGYIAGLVIKQPTAQTSTSELISRQEAIDALDKRFDNIPMEQTAEILMLRKDLRELPTIQPEPQWIPCRNDLPDIGMTVLFCDIDGDEFIGHRALDYWWSVDEKVKSVIAWMPLPEAYKPSK